MTSNTLVTIVQGHRVLTTKKFIAVIKSDGYEGDPNADGAVHVVSPCALINWDELTLFCGHKSLS